MGCGQQNRVGCVRLAGENTLILRQSMMPKIIGIHLRVKDNKK